MAVLMACWRRWCWGSPGIPLVSQATDRPRSGSAKAHELWLPLWPKDRALACGP